MRIIISLTVLTFSLLTFADGVGFQCYSAPGSAVQVYEYASSNCGGVNSDKMAAEIGKDGRKDVLCVHQAVCEPVSGPNSMQEPPQRDIKQIQKLFDSGLYKGSVIPCRGTANYKDGVLVAGSANCPTPTECGNKKSMMFNFAAAAIDPAPAAPIVVPPAPTNQEGARR